MLNMPSVRTMIGLIHTYVINRATMLGLQRFFPLDFTSQRQSQYAEWWVKEVLIGMIGPHQLGTPANILQAPGWTLKRQGTAFWRGSSRLDEKDFLSVADVRDPSLTTLAGRQLVLDRIADIGDQILVLMEWSGWKALNNDLQAFDINGVAMSIDYGLPAKTQVGTAWSNAAASTPFLDIQNELSAFAGTGVTNVDIVFNQYVSSLLSVNEKMIDRIKQSAFALTMGNNAVNGTLKSIIQGEAGEAHPGAPLIRDVLTYSEGYWVDANTYQPFVPNDTVFLIGTGPAVYLETGGNGGDTGTPARWTSTPALKESGLDDITPGPFVTYEEHVKISPKFVAIEGGINGLPTIRRPKWIRRLKITAA